MTPPRKPIPGSAPDTPGKPTVASRRAALALLITDHGIADDCDLALRELGRWAVLEKDVRRCNGGPWWTTADDWRKLLRHSATQECPGEWLAERLFDLDSFRDGEGWSTELTMTYGAPGINAHLDLATITTEIHITGELASAVGRLSAAHPGASAHIAYDTRRAEQLWKVTLDDGAASHAYIVSDETGEADPVAADGDSGGATSPGQAPPKELPSVDADDR